MIAVVGSSLYNEPTMMPLKKISSKRITIRPLVMQDFEVWQKSYAGVQVDRSLATKDTFRKAIHKLKKRAEKDQFYQWGVFLNKTGDYVGSVDVAVINRAPFSWGNLGYEINSAYRGKGYAKEAAKMGLQLAFETLQLHRVEVVMEINNRASKAIAESLKADFEGVRKKFIPTEKGWKDALVYSKTNKNISVLK
ncbi:MAG: GNAT family N-acetyltransferase [Bacillota bacterium]